MLGWIVDTTLVASGLAIVALSAGWVRSVGPAARHALWLAVLIKLVMPPIVAWPWASPSIVPNLDRFWGETRPATVASEQECSDLTMISHPAIEDIEPVERVVDTVSADASDVPSDRTSSKESSSPGVPSIGTGLDDTPWFQRLADPNVAMAIAGGIWLTLSLAMAAGQMLQIRRFRRRLRGATPAPLGLIEETEHIAARLGVRAPRILVVEGLGTPLLWCLGRTRLLLPAALVETLKQDRWPAILTHELAHLRRGDHWVSRLELAAGLVWWWNPIYWLAKQRLDAEAELACDAWVIRALPKDRLQYAEILLDLSANFARACSPAPMLGIAGTGRFLERRLMMILHAETPYRPSRLGLLMTVLLLLFALPSWSGAGTPGAMASAATLVVASEASATVDDDKDDKDDDKDAKSDEDDDDDDDKKEAKARSKADSKKQKAEIRVKGSSLAKLGKFEKKPGLEIAVELQGLGDSIAKETAKIFGSDSDFQAQMQAFGKEIAKTVTEGPYDEKKLEALQALVEKKFGKDSELQAKMEAFGKAIEKKLGDGSEFANKMEAFGKEMESKFGEASEVQKSVKARELSDRDAAKNAEAAAGSKKSAGKVDVEKSNAELKALEARVAWAESIAAWASMVLDKGHSAGKSKSEELYFTLSGEPIDRNKAEQQKSRADRDLARAKTVLAQAKKKLAEAKKLEEAKTIKSSDAKRSADSAAAKTLAVATPRTVSVAERKAVAQKSKEVAKTATTVRRREQDGDRTDKRISELEAQINALRRELKDLAQSAKKDK
jgi:beta-lactamase regulating signal transducer with metallopeptidase domain